MKKLLLFLILPLLLCSCSSLESRTKDGALPYMKKLDKNPDLQSSDMKVIYSCDSLCVVEFVLKAPNGSGGFVSHRVQYARIIFPQAEENKEKELFLNVDDDKGILYQAKEQQRELIENPKYSNWTEDKYIYDIVATMQKMIDIFNK